MREGFDHMRQVFLDLPLSNAQHLRQLMGGESSAGQEMNDPLARGTLGRQHGVMVGDRTIEKPGQETKAACKAWSLSRSPTDHSRKALRRHRRTVLGNPIRVTFFTVLCALPRDPVILASFHTRSLLTKAVTR